MGPSVLALLVALVGAGGVGGGADCRSCHSEVAPTHVYGQRGPVACSACHESHNEAARRSGTMRPTAPSSARCTFCHQKQHALHSSTFGAMKGVECVACHTMHHDSSSALAASPRETCTSCHKTEHPSHAAATGFSQQCTTCHSFARAATGTPTGGALSRSCVGCHKEVAPAHGFSAHQAKRVLCTDCHSIASDSAMPTATVAMSRRCGECHQKEMAGFLAGGHKSALDSVNTNRDAPNCITCHPMKSAADGRADDVRLTATMRCIGCHSRDSLARKYDLPRGAATSYLEDFHGATLKFLWGHPSSDSAGRGGSPAVMACSDCHGAHEVGWKKDAQLAPVCVKCHEAGSPQLASAWLGHTPVGPKNQALIWLVRLFYYVLIPFMLVGLFINIGFHIVDQRRKGARMFDTPGWKRLMSMIKRKPARAEATVTRFTLAERLDHLGVMTSFIVLMVTGLPQTRPTMAAAQWIINALGGIGTTRLIHRTAGFIFVTLMLLHVSRYVIAAIRTKKLPAMVPQKSDFMEVVQTIRHYIWGDPRPRTGRFDVAQRYEYWGLMLGGTLMSATGIALVFPELVSLILPGQALAISRTLHGMEATLAVMVVAVWHVYGVVLRPEVFPLDTSIFTGRISVERLKEEYRLEYERLFPHGHEEEEAAARAV